VPWVCSWKISFSTKNQNSKTYNDFLVKVQEIWKWSPGDPCKDEYESFQIYVSRAISLSLFLLHVVCSIAVVAARAPTLSPSSGPNLVPPFQATEFVFRLIEMPMSSQMAYLHLVKHKIWFLIDLANRPGSGYAYRNLPDRSCDHRPPLAIIRHGLRSFDMACVHGTCLAIRAHVF